MAGHRLAVLIVDDHHLIAQGVATVLESEGIDVTVSTGPTVDDVLEVASAVSPDVVLLDLQLEGAIGSGLPLIGPLSEGGSAVVVLTGVTDEIALAECLEAGAYGLARKCEAFDRLVAKVRAAARGETVTPPHERYALLEQLRAHRLETAERYSPFERLTPRETEVLVGLIGGNQAEAIARESYVSLATVRSQIRSILQKLEVNSQLAAVALAREAGWIPREHART